MCLRKKRGRTPGIRPFPCLLTCPLFELIVSKNRFLAMIIVADTCCSFAQSPVDDNLSFLVPENASQCFLFPENISQYAQYFTVHIWYSQSTSASFIAVQLLLFTQYSGLNFRLPPRCVRTAFQCRFIFSCTGC